MSEYSTGRLFAGAALLVMAPFFLMAEEYSMQAIPAGDPRWEKILAQVNEIVAKQAEEAKKVGTDVLIEVNQHIKDSSYLVTIREAPSSNETGPNSFFVVPGQPTMIRLDLPASHRKLGEGEELQERIVDTGETFEYQTFEGGKATVKACELAGVGDEFSLLQLSEFVNRLKGGETWTLTVEQITNKCAFCRGAKTVNGTACPKCNGKGGEVLERAITIKW